MDKEEARRVLHDHLQMYRRRSYQELVSLLGEPQVTQVLGASGVEYQIEVELHWDHQPGGNIHVLGAIDDGSFRAAFAPVCDGFILTRPEHSPESEP
jgi:hypothetical protein